MDPELRAFISTHKFEQASIETVAEMLPEDDAELDALIEETVKMANFHTFLYVITAALAQDRPVDGRHLRDGACMMPNGEFLGTFFWHMQGDKLDALVHALYHHTMPVPLTIHGLLAAAGWFRKHHEGGWPPDLLRATRKIMRLKLNPKQPKHLLHALAAYLDDPDVNTLLHEHQGKIVQTDHIHDCAVRLAEAQLATYQVHPVALVPKVNRTLGSGTHMRRSLPKISRNDPCHCGSGQKYKRCCLEKDQKLGHIRTHVEGKTHAELEDSREPHLTPENIQNLSRCQLRKMDPEKIPEKVLPWYFLLLGIHGLFQEAVAAFQKLGWREHVKDYAAGWDHVLTFATWAGAQDVIEPMIRVRYPDGNVPDGVLELGIELVRLYPSPDRYLAKLEEMAREVLTCKDGERQQALAYGLMSPLHPAFSLLMVQGMLPVISKQKAMSVLDFMQKLRDRLLLPAEDPFAEILERRFTDAAKASQGKDAQKLRDANDRLQVKTGQLNQLRNQLEQLRRDLRLKEKASQKQSAEGATPSSIELEALKDLREKVKVLKSAMNEHTQERSTLRRALTTAYAELQELRKQPASQSTADSHETEDDDQQSQPVQLEEIQPLRLIEYPKKFHETLTSLPRHISRSAQVLLGRLSAGEPSAFVGIVALRARPDTLRLRVGLDHRLIFRLHSNRLEVVDLINRRDLERRVKSL